jgi:hypothetical protein
VNGRLASAGYRIFGTGPPPPLGSPRKEILLWVRSFYPRMFLFSLPALVCIAVFFSAPWAWVVPCGVVLLQVQGYTSLSRRIRREDRRGDVPRA